MGTVLTTMATMAEALARVAGLCLGQLAPSSGAQASQPRPGLMKAKARFDLNQYVFAEETLSTQRQERPQKLSVAAWCLMPLLLPFLSLGRWRFFSKNVLIQFRPRFRLHQAQSR